ncbi:MAG: methyltransferase domain-containing protein, partial [Bacteroidetes bacterium]|nr:methyltransferase domain-containing protein [Bacteroidota bacterium]
SDKKIGMVGPISNIVSGVQIDKDAKYTSLDEMHEYASSISVRNENANLNTLVALAQVQTERQNYFEAYSLIQKALRENPFHNTALELFRSLNEKIGQHKKEKKWNSRKSVDLLLTAERLIENQKLAEAKNKLVEILNLEPQHIEALNNLAVTNILEKQYESAAELLKSILMIEDTNEVALENYRYLVENNFVNENKEINWEYGFLEYCKGKGIEIGSGGKPLPRLNSLQVDLVDDYNGFKYHVDYLAAADDLSFAENGSFDYIIHSNMLEHLANPVKALIEWHRVIKPNGILYMIVPDKRLWINDRQRNVSYPQEWKYAFQENRSNSPSFPNNPNTHFFAYTPQALVDCFNKTENVSKLYEIVDLYTTSEKAVSQIVDEINVFMPDGDHMMKNYLKIQEIQARNGEYKVGHSFHIVLRVVK